MTIAPDGIRDICSHIHRVDKVAARYEITYLGVDILRPMQLCDLFTFISANVL